MQMLIHFYPAIVTLVSMYCYKRDNTLMQKFYRRMTFSLSARKLFVLVLMLLMLCFNFCYLHTFGLNFALGIASIFTLSLFSFRLTERNLYRLQSRIGIGMAFIVMLACVVKPAMWPLSLNLYIFAIGSMFYPSRKMMWQLESPKPFTKHAVHPATLIEGYYS